MTDRVIARAERLIGITIVRVGRRLAYRDDSVGGTGWWWISLGDIRWVTGPIDYSTWCGCTRHRPVSSRTVERYALSG